MGNKIDLSKKYITRDGREVVIYTATGLDNDKPVVGSVKATETGWFTTDWTETGRANPDRDTEHNLDLIEVKEKLKMTGFLNVHEFSNVPFAYSNRDDAEMGAIKISQTSFGNRIACIDLSKYNIEFEENEGL